MTSESTLPTKKRDWQRLIDDLGLRPNKGRGQNFLFEHGVVHRIVRTANVGPGDHVLEIGPGLGILTLELLNHARRVTAIEIDPTLTHHLENSFGHETRFTLHQADALSFDLGAEFGDAPIKLVANLPYSVAAAIVMHMLESDWNMTSATIMVQREVGDRMLADPPAMSILAVAVQVYASGIDDFEVPPDVFVPSPAVDSLVLTLIPHEQRLISANEREQFFRIVNAGFRHKRKNIANSLVDETRLSKADVSALLSELGIDPMRRAQTLSVDEWLLLHRNWRWPVVGTAP